jgi:hypothetical protein
MADERGTCVIRDLETDEYVLPTDDVVYVAPSVVGPETTDATVPATDDEGARPAEQSAADDADDPGSGAEAPPDEAASSGEPDDDGSSDPQMPDIGSAADPGGSEQ